MVKTSSTDSYTCCIALERLLDSVGTSLVGSGAVALNLIISIRTKNYLKLYAQQLDLHDL